MLVPSMFRLSTVDPTPAPNVIAVAPTLSLLAAPTLPESRLKVRFALAMVEAPVAVSVVTPVVLMSAAEP